MEAITHYIILVLSGTGTIRGNTDFCHTDDHDGSLTLIKLLEREASKTF